VGLKTYTLKLTSALAIGGDILRPGALIEVVETDAKDYLRRGKAVVAEIEDALGFASKTQAAAEAADKAAADEAAENKAASDKAAEEQAEADKLAAVDGGGAQ